MTAEVWNVLTVSTGEKNGGSVSILKNLTYDQAREVMQRIGPFNDPWSDQAIPVFRPAGATYDQGGRRVGAAS